MCVRVCERGFKAKKQHDPIPNSSSTTTTGRFTHARRRQRVNDDCLPTMHRHTAAIRRPTADSIINNNNNSTTKESESGSTEESSTTNNRTVGCTAPHTARGRVVRRVFNSDDNDGHRNCRPTPSYNYTNSSTRTGRGGRWVSTTFHHYRGRKTDTSSNQVAWETKERRKEMEGMSTTMK